MKKLILFFLLCILLFPLCSFAANDGIPYGGVTFGEPKYGLASASFDGVSGYIDVGNGESFNFERTEPFSVEFWAKSPFQKDMLVFGKYAISGSYQGYAVWLYSNGITEVDLQGVESGIWLFTTEPIVANNWHYFVMTYDGSSALSGVKIYIDNVLKNTTFSGTIVSGTIQNSDAALIGVYAYDGIKESFYQGFLDEVAVYNIALSPETISSHFSSTNYQSDVSNTPGLVSYWRFDNNFLDAPVSSVPLSDSELLQQIKDVLDQIDAKTQSIKDVTAGSTAVDWNKTMSFVVGTLSSLAFVFASRMIL